MLPLLRGFYVLRAPLRSQLQFQQTHYGLLQSGYHLDVDRRDWRSLLVLFLSQQDTVVIPIRENTWLTE